MRIRSEAMMLLADLTVREIADIHRVSKSAVHQDMRVRLRRFSPELAERVAEVLERHRREAAYYGGATTQAAIRTAQAAELRARTVAQRLPHGTTPARPASGGHRLSPTAHVAAAVGAALPGRPRPLPLVGGGAG